MYPWELVGRNAIRTKPIIGSDEGWGYCTNPMKILAATEYHIVCERNRMKFLLDSRYIDNCWTDYEELMKLADKEHVEVLQNIIQQINS
jgi:hypothetical protein